MFKRSRTKGQALVEFALAATLIFFLLSAAIDLGLIFLTRQALLNASEEGAAYGSRDGIGLSGSAYTLNAAELRKRVRSEAGVKIDNGKQIGGMRAINLLDLNANGVEDDAEGATASLIKATFVATNSITAAPCTGIRQTCFIVVEVNATYRPFFALAPVFGDAVPVRAYTIRQMRAGSL